MRKLFSAVLAALTCLGILVAIPAAPAVAAPGFDASVTIDDAPDPVKAGGVVIYKVTASATSLAQVFPASVAFTNSGGTLSLAGTKADNCDLPADGTPDPSFTCSVALNAPPVVFYVAINAPGAGSPLSSSVAIGYDPRDLDSIIDDNRANNSDTETTTVTSNSATYLQTNESTTFQGHRVTVRSGEVITELTQAPVTGAGAATCGVQGPCKQGLRVLFYENQTYMGKVLVTVTYGSTHPCGYKAESATCKYLYYRKAPGQPVLSVPKCVLATDTLCYEKKYYSGSWYSGEWKIDVRMNSEDPDLLSPVRGLTTGT